MISFAAGKKSLRHYVIGSSVQCLISSWAAQHEVKGAEYCFVSVTLGLATRNLISKPECFPMTLTFYNHHPVQLGFPAYS